MSFNAMKWAVGQRGLAPSEKIVLIDLADRCDLIGTCFPSISMITERCGLSERTVQAMITRLEDAELIAVKRRPGRGSRNTYTLLPGNDCTVNIAPQSDCTAIDDNITPQNTVSVTPQNGVAYIDNQPSKRTNQEEPTKSIAREPKPRKQPAHPLPDDWVLSLACRNYALSKGIIDPDALAERFTSSHRGKGTLMVKWDQAWQTWVLNEIKFVGNRGSPQLQFGSKDGRRAAAMQRMMGNV